MGPWTGLVEEQSGGLLRLQADHSLLFHEDFDGETHHGCCLEGLEALGRTNISSF